MSIVFTRNGGDGPGASVFSGVVGSRVQGFEGARMEHTGKVATTVCISEEFAFCRFSAASHVSAY